MPLWATAQSVDYSQRLAAVHSVASAEHFMQSLGGQFAGLKLDSLLVDDRENCACYRLRAADSLVVVNLGIRYAIPSPRAWAKADFDQDGQLDLLVNAGYGNVYCLLSQGAKPPLLVLVAENQWTPWDCFSFGIITLENRPAITHLQIGGVKPEHRGHFNVVARQDTLVYHLGDFVEYNPHPAAQVRGRLVFGYNDGGPPPRRVYGLVVRLRTGRVRVATRGIRSEKDRDILGKFRFQLPPGVLDTLRHQVAYVPMKRLAGSYTSSMFDAGTYRFAFHQPFHKPRVVEDYGGNGPYALQRLYSRLEKAYYQAIAQRQQQATRQESNRAEQ